MENVIEVKNLTKEYKKVKAIDNLSFEVHEGEITGVWVVLFKFIVFFIRHRL